MDVIFFFSQVCLILAPFLMALWLAKILIQFVDNVIDKIIESFESMFWGW